MSAAPEVHRLYVRELPARGFVAIDVRLEHSLLHGRRHRGVVVVERRAELRGPRDRPPAIAEASGKTPESVLEQLLPLAQSDPAIAAALVRRQRSSGRSRDTSPRPQAPPPPVVADAPGKGHNAEGNVSRSSPTAHSALRSNSSTARVTS